VKRVKIEGCGVKSGEESILSNTLLIPLLSIPVLIPVSIPQVFFPSLKVHHIQSYPTSSFHTNSLSTLIALGRLCNITEVQGRLGVLSQRICGNKGRPYPRSSKLLGLNLASRQGLLLRSTITSTLILIIVSICSTPAPTSTLGLSCHLLFGTGS
jgi:hypothetical protein